MTKDIEINPDYWCVRCFRCGDMFTQGDMLKKYPERQRDAPPGMYFAKCPGCGKEDYLTNPDIFIQQQALLARQRKGKH